MKKKDRDFLNDLETVILYLKYRNSFSLQFVSYKIFKRRMSYILSNQNYFYIRFLFQHLVIIKVMEKKKGLYRFNPFLKEDPKIIDTIYFE